MHNGLTMTVQGEPKTLPLTWGQRWWWNAFRPDDPDRRRGNILVSNDIRSGMSLGDVLVVVERILEQFEILRTRYGLHDEHGPVQIVEAETSVPVYLYDVTGHDSAPPDDVRESMEDHNFRFLDHPPVCIMVGLDSAGEPVRLLTCLDHIIVDAIGAANLRHHIDSDLAGATATYTAIHQSADQVALENTRGRQRFSARAVEYWRSQLSRTAAPGDWLHRLSEARRETSLNFVRISLKSKFFAAAIPAVARRQNVGSTSVLCHFASLAFERFVGVPPVFNMVVSTRRSSAEEAAVGMYSRSIPVVLDPRRSEVDKNIHNIAETIMRGRLFSACNPDDFDSICREMNWPDRAMIGISLNDVYGAVDEPHSSGVLEHGVDLKMLLKSSQYEQSTFKVYRNAHALKFDLRRDSSDTLRLSIEVDTRVFAAENAWSLLQEIERAAFSYLNRTL